MLVPVQALTAGGAMCAAVGLPGYSGTDVRFPHEREYLCDYATPDVKHMLNTAPLRKLPHAKGLAICPQGSKSNLD